MENLLVGQHILIVEDDYYLAYDTAEAVRRAGATVIGPCANEREALERIKSESPTLALLDINLGLGPSFELARRLKQIDVPLIFITGYNAEIIPDEFAEVPRLQKPVDARQILASLSRALSSRG